MVMINDSAFDAALDWIRTNGTHLSLCSAEPAAYANIAGVELGEATVTVGANADGDTSGRKAQVPATSGETVDSNGTGAWLVLHNNTDTLVAKRAVSASKAVTTSDTWSSSAFDIEIQDPS